MKVPTMPCENFRPGPDEKGASCYVGRLVPQDCKQGCKAYEAMTKYGDVPRWKWLRAVGHEQKS